MPADGLCLYHCLSAATNYDQYLSSSHDDRVTMAQQLRTKTIELLREQGLTGQARRLGKSGYEGYPDEPDFFYLATAAGASFEQAISDRYKPHYGAKPVVARVVLWASA